VRIALVTSAEFPSLTDDDRPLIQAVGRGGAIAVPVCWNELGIAWNDFDCIVLRSCWDYHLQPGEFSNWIERIASSGATVWNPPPLIRWNMDKRYLDALAERGVPVPPTVWLRKGEPVSLGETLSRAGWAHAVVKPTVSAAAMDTWRVRAIRAEELEADFSALLGRGDVMVQRFVDEVIQDGEWSLVFIAGEYSHAVIKRPLAGDFRVQPQHGGCAASAVPTDSVLAQACRIASQLPGPWLFARVDGIVVAGVFLLMEVECIEPRLYLGTHPDSYDRITEGLTSLANQPGT